MSLLDFEKPLVRPALSAEISNRMRRMIMEGELKPGEKVPEKALTERFGVSRTPVREAVKILAHEGFVELVQNRGAIVAHQTTDELRELFPVIAALEGAAGEIAAVNASKGKIAALGDLVVQLRQAYEAADRPAYFEINQKIHRGILEAAGNQTLARHHELLASRIFRARYQANLSTDRWLAATEEHEAIQAALEAREGKRLGELMREHLMHKLTALTRAMAAD
ncbi:putative transcriptional regulator, GntR family protein [Fulvimarina pelagi HTCC2506]|uniref:Putative transcriptional regulator, GntR family protein n=1 Tax=Fulvimarina pelagi HTCC2506 TaxID=314231 RepID=Q0FXK8_9HYPH|nr:GntR family transcriptional regulator [Fulvimarina pelagi]EAU39728.1 putative transcriptional regulator, GntR family protein [Fulvimarina pelagi HTCC2506]